MKRVFASLTQGRFRAIALIVMSAGFYYYGLFWLICILAILIIVYLFINKVKSSALSFLLKLIYVFALAITLRVFVFEVYNIPSESMEDTLFIGDNVLANKLNYGPKLPQSFFEIPWTNILYYFNPNLTEKPFKWKYKRLKGYSTIKRNDVVIFKAPNNANETLIKRCIGMPGDRLEIKNGEVLINGNYINQIAKSKHLYNIFCSNRRVFMHYADSLAIRYLFKNDNDSVTIQAFLTQENLKKLQVLHAIDSALVVTGIVTPRFWQNNKLWTANNFGPILIPSSGTTIKLTTKNYLLYRKLILMNEKKFIYLKNDIFYLNEKSINSYTFKYNYYFMLGDNRDNSNDSRFLGLVPENNVISKASLILFSYKSDSKVDWHRILKML